MISILNAWSFPVFSTITPEMIDAIENTTSLEAIHSQKTSSNKSLTHDSCKQVEQQKIIFKINGLVIHYIEDLFEGLSQNTQFSSFIQALLNTSERSSYPCLFFHEIFDKAFDNNNKNLFSHLIMHERRFLIEIFEKEYKKRNMMFPQINPPSTSISQTKKQILAFFAQTEYPEM